MLCTAGSVIPEFMLAKFLLVEDVVVFENE